MTPKEGLSATPGKVQELIKVEGTHVKMPMTIITGHEPGPTVLVTTGIHGSEFPATLALIEMLRDLTPENIKGRLLVFHPVNSQAFRTRVAAILPEDGANLNRVFPGKAGGTPSERTAWRITEFQDLADFHLDLHSGDLYEELTPFVYYSGLGEEAVIEASVKAARVLNLPYLVRSTSPVGTIGSAALRGTPGLLVERGGAGGCRREDVELYKKDVINVLKHLGLMEGRPEPSSQDPVELGEITYLESAYNGLWVSEVEAGQKVTTGQKLGEMIDFFGKVVEVYEAQHDGVVLYRLNTLSSNAGDVLVAY